MPTDPRTPRRPDGGQPPRTPKSPEGFGMAGEEPRRSKRAKVDPGPPPRRPRPRPAADEASGDAGTGATKVRSKPAPPRNRPGPAPSKNRPKPKAGEPKPWLHRITWKVGVLVVLAGLLLAEAGVRLISGHLPPHQGPEQEIVVKANQIKGLASSGDDPDVLFVGPSTMDAGVDPAAFDKSSTTFDSSYNASLKGMTVSLAQRWLSKTVLPRVDPKLVVVNVQPTLIVVPKGAANADAQRAFASYNYYLRQIEDSPLTSIDKKLSDVSALVKYRTDLQNPSTVFDAVKGTITGAKAPKVNPEDTLSFAEKATSDGGRNLQYGDAPDAVVQDRTMASTLQKVLTNQVALGDTENLLRYLKRNGYAVVVVVMPIDMTTLVPLGLNPKRFTHAVDELTKLDDRLDVPTLDYGDLGLDPLDYHDKVHLADPGTEEFTNRLATDIDKLCADKELSAEACG